LQEQLNNLSAPIKQEPAAKKGAKTPKKLTDDVEQEAKTSVKNPVKIDGAARTD